MKINTLQENLSKAISLASRFTTSKAQLPILGNILLTASKTKLKISSTNLEISVLTAIGAKVEEEGQISIPARVIGEIVNNLPKGNIGIEVDKEHLKIKSQSFSSTVLGMDGRDFPKIPDSIDEKNKVVLNIDNISEGLIRVSFAASADETRPVLTGVLFVFGTEGLQLVATDGFRLSRYYLNIKSLSSVKVVVPKTVLSEISKLGEGSNDVDFEIKDVDKQVIFSVGETVVSSRLIEGEYPDYEKIIPKGGGTVVLIDREEFLRSIKLASVFARESANVVRIKVEKAGILVVAQSSQSGNQETSVDAKVTGEPLEIAFNYKFIEDFLHSIKGEEVKMEFIDGQKAALFTDTSDKNYLHLIMPVRVQ